MVFDFKLNQCIPPLGINPSKPNTFNLKSMSLIFTILKYLKIFKNKIYVFYSIILIWDEIFTLVVHILKSL